MLEIKNLTFAYRKTGKILSDFNMSLPKGSVCGLLGKNGAGKSTLLYLICGLLRPQAGSIRFNGMNPEGRLPEFLEDVFIVPEEFSLPNVMLKDFVSVNAPFYPHFDFEAMKRYLEIFELDENLHFGRVSMGQKKKAFISFAMACNTSLLILDEPTNGLDISSKRNFRKAISNCMTDEKSILISTHQVYDIDKILDYVTIIDRRGILMSDSIADIQEKFTFNFTTDRDRAAEALISLDVPGGMNIIENKGEDDPETEVNLETLFEYAQSINNK